MADTGDELNATASPGILITRSPNQTSPSRRMECSNEDPTPLFVSVDFGLIRDESGKIHPKLVELQAFPTLYGYQAVLGQQYRNLSACLSRLKIFCGDLDLDSYRKLLRDVTVGEHHPENVVLLEIDPRSKDTPRFA